MEFGAINNKRDIYKDIELLRRELNNLQYELKKIYQTTEAKVISKEKDFYRVQVYEEDRILDAVLSSNIEYWQNIGIPERGDNVTVTLKKDMFYVTIIARSTPIDYSTAMQNTNSISKAKSKL